MRCLIHARLAREWPSTSFSIIVKIIFMSEYVVRAVVHMYVHHALVKGANYICLWVASRALDTNMNNGTRYRNDGHLVGLVMALLLKASLAHVEIGARRTVEE
jgi:hypothetical protein